ncbi:MAG TPA: adenylyl-sulfate kinase [Burkholderiaceae bacterium]|nr:adenylyl-sulfate kinase [Burkholderiaceae bacterium]
MSDIAARTIWLTGLPCSGKSTLAAAVGQRLAAMGQVARVLDGDDLRRGLASDLGFAPRDRTENIRRTAEVARLFNEVGIPVIAALVSPSRDDREMARRIVGPARFVEVYLSAPLDVCERRDTKGMYARARRGEIREFTGVDAPYEAPLAPAVAIDSGILSLDLSVERVLSAAAAQASDTD